MGCNLDQDQPKVQLKLQELSCAVFKSVHFSLGHSSQSKTFAKEPASSSTSDGWDDFDDSSWGTLEDTPSKSTTGEDSGLSKQEQMKKKRDERRLKQQAAREKRVAERGLKPGGLGAVKKD